MSKKIQYINLPIYSIITYNQFYIISGGGGGKTGIKNQIIVFKHKIQKSQPVYKLETGDKIIENMYICPENKILIASANENIKIFDVFLGGDKIQFKEKSIFRADYASKNSTIYSLCFQTKRNLLCTAGQDLIIRFFSLDGHQKPSLFFSHNQHAYPLKNVDHNENNLFVSCDTNEIVVFDVDTKKIQRKIYNDQVQPEKCMFQSAYFNDFGAEELIICHFILRKAAYVTKQKNRLFQTVEITKDQSCLTSYDKSLKLLGIACGNGTTYMIKTSNMFVAGKEHNHNFVITGGTISRGGTFVTGTPECSYNVQSIQKSNSQFSSCNCLPFISIIVSLVMIFILGFQLLIFGVVQSDL